MRIVSSDIMTLPLQYSQIPLETDAGTDHLLASFILFFRYVSFSLMKSIPSLVPGQLEVERVARRTEGSRARAVGSAILPRKSSECLVSFGCEPTSSETCSVFYASLCSFADILV